MNVVVIGANSEVSQAFIEELFRHNETVDSLTLLSSNVEVSEKFAQHVGVKYNMKPQVVAYDVMKVEDRESLQHVNADLLFCAAGYLGKDSEHGLYDDENTLRIIDINYGKLVPLINFFAKRMEEKGSGQIIVLSSVAGERGRQSNFIYGSAKAGMTAYLSGLRNYMYPRGVRVMSVIPGFMDTKMTQGLKLNPMLTLNPRSAAAIIYKSWKKGKDVVYMKWMWRWIMMMIRNIPEFMFKKMKL